jgi:hypothetical protein
LAVTDSSTQKPVIRSVLIKQGGCNMKNEIIIGTVAALLASGITYFLNSTQEQISKVQRQELATNITNNDAFNKVLIDALAEDTRFRPKDGLDGSDGSDGISDIIPKGAIVSFNLSECPSSWAAYIPAYGKFIRGIDKSGQKIDPDGERALGNSQSDIFGSHSHESRMEIGAEPHTGAAQASEGAGAHGRKGVNYISRGHIAASGGKETRPKNVSLLYCEKL